MSKFIFAFGSLVFTCLVVILAGMATVEAQKVSTHARGFGQAGDAADYNNGMIRKVEMTDVKEGAPTEKYEFWGNYFSEEMPNFSVGLPGFYVAGYRCTGRYCDNQQLLFRSYNTFNLDKQLLAENTAWVQQTFSDETAPFENTENRNLLISGLQCQGRFCDNLKPMVTQKIGARVDLSKGLWSHWISEEAPLNEYIAPEGWFIVGFQCQGAYCDNLRFKIAPLVDMPGEDLVYVVSINGQKWMAANLNVSKFRNGDPIPEARTAAEWVAAGKEKKPAWCYYNNDPNLGKIYGKLYNFYAVNDPRGLAPEGWQVPAAGYYGPFRVLTNSLGGNQVAGGQLKEPGFRYWASPNTLATNLSHFNARAGGWRDAGGNFRDLGLYGLFFTSSGGIWSGPTAPAREMVPVVYVKHDWAGISEKESDFASGYSVRCIAEGQS